MLALSKNCYYRVKGRGENNKHPFLVMKGKNRQRKYYDDEYDDECWLYGRSPTSLSTSFSSSSHTMDNIKRQPPLKPRNEKQREYMNALEGTHPTIVVATGAAGTGKTMIACTIAIEKLLENDGVSKLVITRPMVNVDDDDGIGFLPGSLEEKCAPWMAPLTDTFYKHVSPQKFQGLIAKHAIEICPLEMMRGRSFEDCFIIVDEAQNCSTTQMLMLLTRIGKNSKLIITGDPMQHDRARGVNGLSDFLQRIANAETNHPERVADIKTVHFTEECIVRHPIIKNILKMYDVSYPPTI